MNKKFLSLVLALVMVLGTFSSVFAAKPAEKKEAKEAPKATEKVVPKITGKTEKIKWLQNEGVIVGRKVNEDPKNNDLALDKNIQRAEVSKLLVYAIGRENLANKIAGTFKPYSDVDNKHWANGFITVGSTEKSPANELAFLIGYPDKTFKPANDVTYAELAKMLVTLAKTDLTKAMHDQANKDWPRQWMAWAAEMGILEDVKVENSNAPAVREDAFTMIYNAMYKLRNLKQFPVDETLGVISQIKNGEITLNQGEKAKTVKLTANTTFVLYDRTSSENTLDVNAERPMRAVLASALSNPQYYYGSLVRVIVNEKGEATHVLELGNPEQLGLRGRWAGVADDVINTVSVNPRTSNAVQAQIKYVNGDAKSIYFLNEAQRYLQGTELRLTSATRYFVADVDRNQLTEVKNVEEALRIVGNRDAAGLIDRVYAGYDVFEGGKAHETSSPTAINGYNEAKVVVFNRVQKDNNGTQMLRVKMDANTNYNITLQDVDGKDVVKNVVSYRGGFPANYRAKKLDVVNYSVNSAYGIVIDRVIEHANKNMFPVVKVKDIDGRKLVVEDKYGNTARMLLDTEANIFFNGELKQNALIQFHTLAENVLSNSGSGAFDATQTNTVDVVSVMPEGISMDGSLDNVVYKNQFNQAYGHIALGNFLSYGDQFYKVKIDNVKEFYGDLKITTRDLFKLNKTEGDSLRLFLAAHGNNTDIRFKVRHVAVDEYEVYDVEVKDGDHWRLVTTVVPSAGKVKEEEALKQENAILAFIAKVGTKTQAAYENDFAKDQAKYDKEATDLTNLTTEYNALPVDKMDASVAQLRQEAAKKALNDRIKAFNDAAKAKGITPATSVSEVK